MNKDSYKLIAKYFAPFKLSLIGVFIASCITAATTLCIGRGMLYLIDMGFNNHSIKILNQALMILIAIILLLAFATFCRSLLINSVAEKLMYNIRKDVYTNIINISPYYFELHKTSDVISRLTADTALLSALIPSILSFSLRNILMTIGGIILLYVTSPKLTLYTLIVVPLLLILIIYFAKKVRKASKISHESLSSLASHIEETINGIKIVQSNNHQLYEINNFVTKLTNNEIMALESVRLRAMMAAIVIFFVFLAIIFVLWIGGAGVISGSMSAGSLTSFIFYAVIVATSIAGISEIVGDAQRAIGATEGLFALLKIKSHIIENPNPIKIPDDNYPIVFTNLSFSYPSRPDIEAVSNMNLVINPGETIALVGPSGSGKTTIFQLLLRFYDPSSGAIKLGEHNIKNIKLADLRAFFAYVPQEPVIFSANAYDNICYGKLDANLEQVRQAAQSAEILEFIDSLPKGMNSFLGEKGIRISGGQKQRIVIARAILRNPKILLLDEATSNLDTHNETLVQSAIDKLMIGRTTIIIAHRLSTIINADKIIVINKGKIEAIGTHQELINTNVLYAHLVTLKND